MRFHQIHFVTLFLISFTAEGAILQTVTGPVVATGGGAGTNLIDTTNDAGDWIDGINGGGSVYLAFDWVISNNAGETGSGGFFGGLGVYNGGGERLLIGNGWSETSYSGGTGAGGISDTGVPYQVGVPVRLVTRLTLVDGGTNNDSWEMWVDPANGDEGNPQAGNAAFTLDDFTRLTHRAGNSPGEAILSNLVVATTWDDVVPIPEPGSSWFIVAAGVLMGWRRRR